MSSLTASALAEIRAVVTGPKHGPVCHGVVTRDGHEDACGKPAVAVIGRSIAHGAPWAACGWHAHRYGQGRLVTLATIAQALEDRSL